MPSSNLSLRTASFLMVLFSAAKYMPGVNHIIPQLFVVSFWVFINIATIILSLVTEVTVK
jgi:hypothetical protein